MSRSAAAKTPTRYVQVRSPEPRPAGGSVTAAQRTAADAALIAQASAGHLSPAILTSRGWTCFEPIPNRIVCSHPNQGFPTFGDPPPDDRPASFSFFIFNSTDRFVGTELLLRTDLYKGQVCESTGVTVRLCAGDWLLRMHSHAGSLIAGCVRRVRAHSLHRPLEARGHL